MEHNSWCKWLRYAKSKQMMREKESLHFANIINGCSDTRRAGMNAKGEYMYETMPVFLFSLYHHVQRSGWLALKQRYVIGQWMKKKKAKAKFHLVLKEEKVCGI